VPRRADAVLGVLLALAVAVGAGCGAPVGQRQTVMVGRNPVRFVLPRGWEHLDHGREQLFRTGEAQISLADHGPVTREAVAREIRAAERLWRDGRRADAFRRVLDLRSPVLQFTSEARAKDFWRPWLEATSGPGDPDSLAVGAAFAALVAGTDSLAQPTAEQLQQYAFALASDPRRSEVERLESKTLHGAEWTDVHVWDRTSHLNRSRFAFMVNDGYLLVLQSDRGVFERVEPAFEALLGSLEVGARPAAVR
jgi:hypothetical protein